MAEVLFCMHTLSNVFSLYFFFKKVRNSLTQSFLILLGMSRGEKKSIFIWKPRPPVKNMRGSIFRAHVFKTILNFAVVIKIEP